VNGRPSARGGGPLRADGGPLRDQGDPGVDLETDRLLNEAGADDPLALLLERYAAARLAPDEEQLTYLRAVSVRAYVDRRPRDIRSARSRRAMLAWPRRLAAGFAIVFALTGGASLVAAESGPGQPFYHLKLTVDSLTLPAQGSARVQALLDRLDARLADVRQAGVRNDHAAVADATGAYEANLTDLTDAINASGADAFVLDELNRHVTILEGLLGQLPPQAQAGLQHALDHAQQARDAINQRHGPPSSRPSPGSQRSPGAGASNRP
jgi:hypothetical protein